MLEKTPAVTEFIRLSAEPTSMAQPWLPQPVWRAIAPIVMKPMWLLGVGLLEPETRETLGLRLDQRRRAQTPSSRRDHPDDLAAAAARRALYAEGEVRVPPGRLATSGENVTRRRDKLFSR